MQIVDTGCFKSLCRFTAAYIFLTGEGMKTQLIFPGRCQSSLCNKNLNTKSKKRMLYEFFCVLLQMVIMQALVYTTHIESVFRALTRHIVIDG